jgi:hypothetical protein
MQQMVEDTALRAERERVDLRILGLPEVVEATALRKNALGRLVHRAERLRCEDAHAQQR